MHSKSKVLTFYHKTSSFVTVAKIHYRAMLMSSSFVSFTYIHLFIGTNITSKFVKRINLVKMTVRLEVGEDILDLNTH